MFKIILILSVLIVTASCSVLKNKLFNIFYYSPVSAEEFYTEVPLEIDDDLLFIHVKINNIQYRMLIDTGSPTFLFSNAQKSLNLPHYHTSKSTDINGAVELNETVLGQLELGTLVIPDFKFRIKDSIDFGCHKHFDGILGNDILNQGIFYFNTSHKKLIITSDINKIKGIELFKKYRAKVVQGAVFVKFIKTYFKFDSGFESGFILSNSKYFDESKPFKRYNYISGGTHSNKISSVILQDFSFETKGNIYSGIIHLNDEFNKNNLGSMWFVENDLIFYTKKNQILIRKGVDQKKKSLGFSSNINFFFENGEVSFLSIESSVKSLSLTDKIIQINGTKMSEIESDCALQEFLRNQDKELGFNLDLKRDRDTISVFLSKEDLFNTF